MITNNCSNDWVYAVKRALNYKIYSNPDIMANIIDMITNELYNRFHNHVKVFNFDDNNKTITVKVETALGSSLANDALRILFEDCIVSFCTSYSYKPVIESAIREVSGPTYQKIFSDIIEYGQIRSLRQLITVQAFTVNNESTAILRFF